MRLCLLPLLATLPLLAQTSVVRLPPAQDRINRAEAEVAKFPKKIQGYNNLARAYVQRVRETNDPSHLVKAEQALKKSFEIEPANLEAQKVKAAILLSRHEYAAARDLARELNKKNADDVSIYGLVADADLALGEYKEAEEMTQWMLDLRPTYPGGIIHGALLRELFGDVEGANEFWTSAFRLTSDRETEERAWISTNAAAMYLGVGKLDSADKLLAQALQLFPAYPYAGIVLGKLRLAQKRYPDAVSLLQNATAPRELYPLAQAFESAGKSDDAARTYAEFEKKALAQSNSPDNANRELILYYVDRAHKPAEALKIARAEIARRHDVYTLDAYAWALHASGDDAEARKQMDKVLAVGVRATAILQHAEQIGSKPRNPASSD